MQKIMFNDRFLLTDSVLRGEKTQTRRMIKPQPILTEHAGFKWKNHLYGLGFDKKNTYKNFLGSIKTPYKIGEVVAVAQSYKNAGIEWVLGDKGNDMNILHKAEELKGWNNKMYVRADLMPHQIKITNVRVQRLQEITDEECLLEGVREIEVSNNWGNSTTHTEYSIIYYDHKGLTKELRGRTPKEVYSILIDKIHGYGTWESNPWVFVYDFEILKK